MRIGLTLSAVAAAALAGCVEQQAASYKTPSGRAEAFFAGTSPSTVSQRLVGLCADAGILVQRAESNQVVCGGEMQGGDAILAQMAIGNAYSTTPARFVQFMLFPYNGGTRVQTQQWVETQMAFGQTNRVELNSGAQFNEIMTALTKVGGRPFGAQVIQKSTDK